jgi:hypothetical protein
MMDLTIISIEASTNAETAEATHVEQETEQHACEA